MATQENQSQNTDQLNRALTSAKSAKTAIKAAGKAAAGDIAGAVLDIVKDGELRNKIISAVVAICFLIVFIFTALGSPIVMIVELCISIWSDNYDELAQENAIESRGNKLWLMFSNTGAVFEATWNTVSELFTGPDNHAAGTDFDSDDYKTTVDAVIEQEALAGADGALMKRIELIRGRVEERGDQLQDTLSDYNWDTFGLKVALNICEKANNFFLYNGISNVTLNVDTSCFSLTDIQCVKILAAYCVQNECDIHSVDIVDLMDYLGWYALDNGSASMEDSVDAGTIYATPLIGRFVDEFYGAYSSGTAAGTGETNSIELSPPSIPIWKGTFLPQYLVEEMAQLKAMEAEGEIILPRDRHGNIDWEECSANYESEAGMGIIDYLYTGSAFASFSRTEYTGIDESIDEFLAELVDKGLDAIADWWNDLWGNEEPTSISATKQGVNGKCTVKKTMYADGSASTYSVITSEDLVVYLPQSVFISQTGSDEYTEMISRNVIGGDAIDEPILGGSHFAEGGLLPDTEYSIYISRHDENGEIVYDWIDTFTTVFDTDDGTVYQAYQIEIAIDVTYRARSVDELALDIVGLWPGNLKDVESNNAGSLRPIGHTNNSLLKLTWNDFITDDSGNAQSVAFTRMRGYQYEYYLDYVAGVADTLNLDTSGIFTPEFNYGDTLVSIANEEFTYYEMNNLRDGYRYWDICTSITGENYTTESRNGTDWSAVFVLCCAYQCGYLGDDNCFGGFGSNAATWPITCAELYNSMLTYSDAESFTDADYAPSPGDLIFFSTMGAESRTPEHVAIVTGVSPSGELFTIEGDSHNEVQKSTYDSYRVGAYAYDGAQGPVYISAYISPHYETQYAIGTQYMYNHALATTELAGITQVHIHHIPTTTILLGAGRFRLSQLQNVLDLIAEHHPNLANDHFGALYEAVEVALERQQASTLSAIDISRICDRWYTFALESSGNIGQILTEISAQQYVGPLMEYIRTNYHFDWNKTAIRREILWQIATSTDSTYAAQQTLNALISGETDELSDEALLTKLMTPVEATAEDGTVTTVATSYMAQVLSDNQMLLWPEDHTYLRDAWIDCAEANLNILRDRYLSGTYAYS